MEEKGGGTEKVGKERSSFYQQCLPTSDLSSRNKHKAVWQCRPEAKHYDLVIIINKVS